MENAAATLFCLFLSMVLVVLCVGIHFETLRRLPHFMMRLHRLHRVRVALGVLVLQVAHIAEVMLFAFGYQLLAAVFPEGALQGDTSGGFEDYVYFSFSTYTSLGFGDLTPVGHVRLMSGIEALAGLGMITWSASFLYLEMERHWRLR